MIFNLLHRAFVAPFSDPSRFALYAGAFLGSLGFDIIAMVFSYDLAKDSARSLIVFWGGYFVLSGLIVFPALCWACTKLSIGRVRALFLALMAAGLGFYLAADGGLIMTTIGNALVASPMWVAYHVMLYSYSSDENRGSEVALAYVMNITGTAAGYAVGGIMLQAVSAAMGVAIGFGVTALAVILLVIFLPATNNGAAFFRPLRDMLRQPGMAQVATGGIGGHGVLSSILLPTFLALSGMRPLAAGLTMALRVAACMGTAPLAGHLIARAKHHEMRFGVTLLGLGWIFLLLPAPLPVRLVCAIIVWTMGLQLYNSGMDTQWYSHRSTAAVAAREIYLNAGRLAVLCLAAPFLFMAPAWYPLLAVAYVAVLGSALWVITARRVRT